jgi:hypothetical protein
MMPRKTGEKLVKQIGFNVEKSIYMRVRNLAAKRHITIANQLRTWIVEKLEEEEERKH